MKIVANVKLNETWDLVLCMRDDCPDYPFVVTTNNKKTNELFWNSEWDNVNMKGVGLAITGNQHIAMQVFIANVHLLQRFNFRP